MLLWLGRLVWRTRLSLLYQCSVIRCIVVYMLHNKIGIICKGDFMDSSLMLCILTYFCYFNRIDKFTVSCYMYIFFIILLLFDIIQISRIKFRFDYFIARQLSVIIRNQEKLLYYPPTYYFLVEYRLNPCNIYYLISHHYYYYYVQI